MGVNVDISYLFCYLSISFICGQNDVCIWNTKNSATTYINGLYSYTTTQTNYVYYEKVDQNCADNTLYLYVKASKWVIGPTIDSSSYIAACSADTHSSNPTDCEEWEVNGSVDSNIRIYDESCPVLSECDALNIVYAIGCDDCCGEFTKSEDSSDKHVFVQPKPFSFVYLYFSEHDFRWICTNDTAAMDVSGECRVDDFSAYANIWAYSTNPQWIDMTKNQWRMFEWSSSTNQSAYFECKSYSTPTPTLADGQTLSPTVSPNTQSPTAQSVAYRPGIMYHTIFSVLLVISTLCCVFYDDC